MSAIGNRTILKAADEAFLRRDWKAFASLHAESVIVHSPLSTDPTKGREAHVEQLTNILTAFPDLRVDTIRAFGEGPWMCCEQTMTGTHTGPLPGPAGQLLPPTNMAIRLDVCTVFKLEGGQITEEHLYFELAGLMAQLGFAPGPEV